jgi:phosphoglycolate phosphatase
VPADKFLYLGDTGTDMKTARGAGMFPVGALWGFRAAEELNDTGAKVLVAHPSEVLQFL